LLPKASLSRTVITAVLGPEGGIVSGVAWTVERAVLATPTVKRTVADEASSAPLIVPVIVAVPTVVLEVKTAVYVPLLLSVALPRTPAVVFRATVPPVDVSRLPLASFN
jgi:hypothetical protein